jgi:hypothetical protein
MDNHVMQMPQAEYRQMKLSSPDWIQSTTLSKSIDLIGYNKQHCREVEV